MLKVSEFQVINCGLAVCWVRDKDDRFWNVWNFLTRLHRVRTENILWTETLSKSLT